MVSKTFQRNKVFSWSLNFDKTNENGDWFVHYYDPDGVTMYKIKIDATTVTMAKGLITQITAWMSGSDTWAGTIVETWKRQDVTHPSSVVNEWVKQ